MAAPAPPTKPSGSDWRHAIRRIAVGPVGGSALRLLAVMASAAVLAVLIFFAALQGGLDGDWSGARYWRRYWPLWLLFAPALSGFVLAMAGRAGWGLKLAAGTILLAAGMILLAG